MEQRTELVDERTADSRTYANPDGSRTTELLSQPVHYRPDGSDAWDDIKVGFEAVAGAPGEAVSAKAPVAVSVRRSDDDGGFLEFVSGEQTVSLRPLPAKDAGGSDVPVASRAPQLDGPVADYPNVIGDIDLRVIAGATGAKSFLILPGPPPDNAFSFAVDAPGLTLVTADDGGLDFVDEDGRRWNA